jgi:hypothetical protein
MKDKFLIEITQPDTEECRECGFKQFYSFFSCHAICPVCGKERMSGIYNEKNYAVWCSFNHGSYDFAHPSNKQYSYRFYNLPKGFHSNYLVNEELDISDPLQLAEELNSIIQKYIYNSDKPKIKEVLEYLQREDIQEKQDELNIDFQRRKLNREMYKFYYRKEEFHK